jgi:hypothetical protein
LATISARRIVLNPAAASDDAAPVELLVTLLQQIAVLRPQALMIERVD